MQTLEADTTRTVVHDQDRVRSISIPMVFEALRRGASDFWRWPSHYVFLVIIYPVVGFVIAIWTAGGQSFPLLYPIATGFALLGPLAAIGLYEISRRREQGKDDHPVNAFNVFRSPALGAIMLLGLFLAVVFGMWVATAHAIYTHHYDGGAPGTLMALLASIFTTPQGWGLLIWGNLAGLCFALFVLATTAVAFPRLIDRGGSALSAMETSLRVFLANPLPMLAWGITVAVLLFLGSLPLFVGLAVVLPILGHATWHLYRATVE